MESGLKVVRGLKFADEQVRLDGIEFVDCDLRNCELVYSGGPPFIFGNTPVEGCQIVFEGAAQNTLDTLAVLYNCGMHEIVEGVFEHVRNPFNDTVQ